MTTTTAETTGRVPGTARVGGTDAEARRRWRLPGRATNGRTVDTRFVQERMEAGVGGRPGRAEAESAAEAATGLHEPGSVTWRLHSDPLLGLATLRALLLRGLHPAGLATAPGGRSDDGPEPWGRVHGSLRRVGVLTFGSALEAMTAVARDRAMLALVDAGSGPDGSLRGDDPELLLWAHCCQVASYLDVLRRGGVRISPAEQGRYLREQLRDATLWGLDPGDVPADPGALTRYFRRARPSMPPTPAARAFAGAVVAPPLPEAMTLLDRSRPAWSAVAGLAFAALPSWARSAYELPYRTGPAALRPAATTVALHSLRDSLLDRRAELL